MKITAHKVFVQAEARNEHYNKTTLLWSGDWVNRVRRERTVRANYPARNVVLGREKE